MKKLLIICFTLLTSLGCNAQSAKVIRITKTIQGLDFKVDPGCYPYRIFDGNKIGIDIGQDGTQISQAQFKLFKKEVWTAAQGHGYILEKSKTIVRATPSDAGKAIGKIDGLVDGYPDCYECLGVSGNWYKIRNADHIGNWKVGYVKKSTVDWSICHAECAGCIR